MRIVVTAGPTREHLDPVRFLSNPSTGKMGFAIAAEAARRGHDVTLIAGPVSLKTPKGVKRIDVVSAREMLAACLGEIENVKWKMENDGRLAFVSTAAVADWRPAKCAAKKLKKGEMSSTLKLVRNPDILKTLARQVRAQRSEVRDQGQRSEVRDQGQRSEVRDQTNELAKSTVHLHLSPSPSSLTLIGFAAETNDVLAEAARKCREKGLSFIVANDVTQKGCGFGTDTNKVTFVFPDGTQKKFPLMPKRMVAKNIIKEIEK